MTVTEETTSTTDAADDGILRITMPKWGLSMESGKVTDWFVAEGDEVSAGQELCEIDTDKIAGALECSGEGVVRALVVETGVDVPVGGTIALVAAADVPQAAVEAALTRAREQLESGETAEDSGPKLATVDVGGRTISYSVLSPPEGSAAAAAVPVVLVHGYGGDKNSWLFVQEPLAADRPVYALDLPGHGESSKDTGDGSAGALAETVVAFLDAIGAPRAHLVGHSLGGAVAVLAAGRAGDRVASLTLLAPAAIGSGINADYLRGFASAGTRRELKPHLLHLFADQSLVQRQMIDDLLAYKRKDGVAAALAGLADGLLDGDTVRADVVAQVGAARGDFTGPTVVVWGEADAVVPIANASALGDAVPVHRLDGVGHMAHMERPSEVVAAVQEAVGRA